MLSTRRQFLTRSLGAAGLLWLRSTPAPALLGQTAAATPARGDTILVAIQLSGGNDGLNTVVPYQDDHYHRARPTLRLSEKEVLKIDAGLGFHPQMPGFQRLYKEGRLSIVQGVGYPSVNGNHQVSMAIWQTAGLHADSDTGWLGRTVDQLDGPEEPGSPGVFVGQTKRPLAINAQRATVPILRAIDDCTLREKMGTGTPPAADRQAVISGFTPHCVREAVAHPLLEFVRGTAASAYAGSAKVQQVVQKPGGAGGYPPLALAENLQVVAQLIRADLAVRIFLTELGGDGFGGFDNHANQAPNHAALLRHLSESLAAFVDDLSRDRLLERVLVMTYSEFGRTVAENGRRGTDHGDAAPIFLAGGRLKGGLVGCHPSLTDLERGNLKSHTDFRSAYATLLDQWLGVDSLAVLGRRFPPLDLLRA